MNNNVILLLPIVLQYHFNDVYVNKYHGLLDFGVTLEGYKDHDFDIPISLKYNPVVLCLQNVLLDEFQCGFQLKRTGDSIRSWVNSINNYFFNENFNTAYTYDKHGNILSLSRFGLVHPNWDYYHHSGNRYISKRRSSNNGIRYGRSRNDRLCRQQNL